LDHYSLLSPQIPFYTKRITNEAINRGKRVLITSHENALRGILMHLCGIPEEAMTQLHIPNGVPLVYNVKAKCITLLEDKESNEPISIEDFGPAAKYLFQPCELDDEFFESNIERVETTSSVPHDRDAPTPAIDSTSIHSFPVNIEKDIKIISSEFSSPPPTNVSTVLHLSP
jgi:hypothetical protein